MSQIKKNRFEVQLLSRHYVQSKRIVTEAEQCIKRCPTHRLISHRNIVSHIEYVVDCLEERDKFIIYNEVVLGKNGKWYLEYFSAPTYYRNRDKAYAQFLACL